MAAATRATQAHFSRCLGWPRCTKSAEFGHQCALLGARQTRMRSWTEPGEQPHLFELFSASSAAELRMSFEKFNFFY